MKNEIVSIVFLFCFFIFFYFVLGSCENIFSICKNKKDKKKNYLCLVALISVSSLCYYFAYYFHHL